MRQLVSCIVLIASMIGTSLPAAAAKRVALVVGNGAYQNTEPLPNPANDGRKVAAALRRLGFDVIEGTDQDKAGMQTLLRQFSAELQGADASLFFYAGHGLQVQRRNWMVPVDAVLQSEIDLPFEGVAVDTVLDLMEETTPLRLVFLDACRDNPLARRLSRSAPSRSLGVGRGLARMNNRVGTLIAFATEPDQVALDGDGSHSPFTEALLEHIETPGLEVRQMLSRVRATVISNTDGQQLPLDTSALIEDFFFTSTPAPEPAPTEPAPIAPDIASTEHLFWQSIQASNDPNDFRAYLERYPDGAFAPLARNRLAALSAAPQSEVAALPPPTEAPPAATPPAAPPVAEIVEVEVEPLDTTVVATRNVNVRGVPNTDGDPLGVVAQGTEVAVTGKVIGGNWYRIRRPDGGEAYVYAPLFAPPETVVAHTPPEPAQVAAVPAQPPPSQATATEAEPAPPEPAQTAAVAPHVVAPRMNRQSATPPGAVPAPQVDAAALLQTIGKRRPNSLLRFTFRVRGDQGTEFVAFDQWEDAGSSNDAPTWKFGDPGRTRVQTSSETFGESMLASQVTPELFGVLMYSRVMHGGRATFNTVTAENALKQWTFLVQNGARVQSTSSLVLDHVQFEVAALTLQPDAPAASCLGFVAIQVRKRVDGFVCRTEGPAFDASQASPVLSQIHVPRLIEP
jgi:Caspase domain/Bacterial SH3 domain